MSHTIEQLWSERIEHGMPWVPGLKIPKKFRHRYVSVNPIRIFSDTYQPEREYNWGTRLADSWITYNYIATTRSKLPWWMPKLNTWFDKLRYRLHLKLIQWKFVL